MDEILKEIQLHIDNLGYSEKPSGNEIKSISNRITRSVSIVTPAELANMVGNLGQTVVLATMHGKRHKANIIQQQVLALDFDNDTTKNIEMFYDIGVAWLFLNSFKQKLKKANQFNAIDMDIEAYKKYLHTVLMVKYKDDKKYEKYHQQDESDATFLEKYRIKKSQVKFEKGIKYMDSLKIFHYNSL